MLSSGKQTRVQDLTEKHKFFENRSMNHNKARTLKSMPWDLFTVLFPGVVHWVITPFKRKVSRERIFGRASTGQKRKKNTISTCTVKHVFFAIFPISTILGFPIQGPWPYYKSPSKIVCFHANSEISSRRLWAERHQTRPLKGRPWDFHRLRLAPSRTDLTGNFTSKPSRLPSES